MKKSPYSLKHTILILTIVCATLVLLFAVGIHWIHSDAKTKYGNLPPYQAQNTQQLAEMLSNTLGFQDLTPLETEQIGKYYALPKPLLDTAAVYTAGTQTDLREIVVFRNPKNGRERDMIFSALNDRVAAYLKSRNLTSANIQSDLYYIASNDMYTVLVIGLPYEEVSADLQSVEKSG